MNTKIKLNKSTKQSPNYTSILKSIAKAKTKREINKAQRMVVRYEGSHPKAMTLIEKYNIKNRKITFGKS